MDTHLMTIYSNRSIAHAGVARGYWISNSVQPGSVAG